MEWTLEAIAGFTTAGILFVTVLVTGLVALWQLRAATRARSAQIEMQLVQDLTNAEAKKKLSSIYEMEPSQVDQLEPGSESACGIEAVLDKLGMLGTFVDKGIVDKKIAIEEWQDPAIRLWWRLRSYIVRQRNKRGHYGSQLQVFVERCIKHQIDTFAGEEWTKYEGVNIVEILLESEDFSHLKSRIARKARDSQKLGSQ